MLDYSFKKYQYLFKKPLSKLSLCLCVCNLWIHLISCFLCMYTEENPVTSKMHLMLSKVCLDRLKCLTTNEYGDFLWMACLGRTENVLYYVKAFTRKIRELDNTVGVRYDKRGT